MTKLKVMTILGTRPEIIRLSVVMKKLDQFTNHKIVHTGQNYDYKLNEVFFEELGVREPDYFLEAAGSSLGETMGNILISSEKVLLKEQPDAVLILGDTNSSLACIIARRMKIPIYHMEAGNRCFDLNVPEESNRKIVDHTSDFNLVYSEHARRNLLAEGLHPRRVYLTGSPMKEVLSVHKEGIEASTALEQLGLTKEKYVLASIHREENVDNRANLELLIQSFEEVSSAYSCPVIVSTHPRTRKRLEQFNLGCKDESIRFLEPFGFFDYNNLQMNAFCVMSDSGTISEESAILDFPAITIRRSMERPEAMDTGSIIMTGLDPDVIVPAIGLATDRFKGNPTREVPDVYEVENVASRVVSLILGTTRLSNDWSGIKKNSEGLK